jgi:hypothetical protein
LRNAAAKQLELQQLKGERAREREREREARETAAGLYAALGRVVGLCAGRCVERVADRQGCMPPLKQTQINPPIYLFIIFLIYEKKNPLCPPNFSCYLQIFSFLPLR